MSTEGKTYMIDGYAIIGALRVPTIYPARRCAAPGCGDKIKGEGETWQLQLASNPHSVVYVHDSCFDLEVLGVFNWPVM